MQNRRQTAYVPRHTRKKARPEPLKRIELMALAGAGALCLALSVPIWTRGANEALLQLSVPAYAVLRAARPAATPAEAPEEPSRTLQVELEETQPQAVEVAAVADPPAPHILIYHTHATEAYLPTEAEPYEASGKWRTQDAEKSVVAVGELLKQLLETEYGIGVLHDTGNYEPPRLAGAYSRSLAAMERYQTQYPSITIFIDVHRDAYGSAQEIDEPKDYVELDGKQVARLMFVVGTGAGATGTGFGQKPDFESNLALAQAITDRLSAQNASLTRDVRIKTGRYNQHVSASCLLVEAGHNANTLTQAKNAMPYLAQAIAACIDTPKTPATLASMAVWTP